MGNYPLHQSECLRSALPIDNCAGAIASFNPDHSFAPSHDGPSPDLVTSESFSVGPSSAPSSIDNSAGAVASFDADRFFATSQDASSGMAASEYFNVSSLSETSTAHLNADWMATLESYAPSLGHAWLDGVDPTHQSESLSSISPIDTSNRPGTIMSFDADRFFATSQDGPSSDMAASKSFNIGPSSETSTAHFNTDWMATLKPHTPSAWLDRADPTRQSKSLSTVSPIDASNRPGTVASFDASPLLSHDDASNCSGMAMSESFDVDLSSAASGHDIATPTTRLITDLMAIPEPYPPSLGLVWLDGVDPVEDVPLSNIMTFGWESASSASSSQTTASSSRSSAAPSSFSAGSSKAQSTSDASHGGSKVLTEVLAKHRAKSRQLLTKRRVRVANPGLSGPLPAITRGLPFSNGPSDVKPLAPLDISSAEGFNSFVKNTLAPTVTNIMICKMIGSPNAFTSNQQAALVPFDLDETRIPSADTPSQRLYTEAFHAAKFRLHRLILDHETIIPSKFDSCEGRFFHSCISTGQVSSTLQDKVRS
jgi:hypothetical protein